MLHVCNQHFKQRKHNWQFGSSGAGKEGGLAYKDICRDLSSPTEGGGQVNYPLLEEVRVLGNRKGSKLFIGNRGSQRRRFFWETPPQSRPLFTAYVFLTETF